MSILKKSLITTVASLALSSALHADTQKLDMKFAGALEFSPKGELFVGDNVNGAIYEFDVTKGTKPSKINPIKIDNIDVKISELLGVNKSAVVINDMEVNPVTQNIYISASRIGNGTTIPKPAVVKVTQSGKIELVDLKKLKFSKQSLDSYPTLNTTFRPRGLMGNPPTAKDLAKGDKMLKSHAIMDMQYYKGKLYVAGVATDNFLSTLRTINYPFDGKQTMTNVEIYHIAHDQYETRAPIRSMAIEKIDGKEQIVAAYTCSPLVLIPLDELKDGAKITGNTIGDMGNGQPIDMIHYKLQGKNMLFVTSNSRSPRAIPLDGLKGAKALSYKDFKRGPKLDVGGVIPTGPVGQTVMFEGVPLHMSLLGDNYFTSITRDAMTGMLNLDSNATFFPNRVHHLEAEYDYPQYYTEKNEKNEIIKAQAKKK